MTPRRILFWVHLTAGSVAGKVILVMSVTGVLLAYRRQVIGWADRSFQAQPAPGARRLPVEELLARLQAAQGRMPSGITVRSEADAPVAFDLGRARADNSSHGPAPHASRPEISGDLLLHRRDERSKVVTNPPALAPARRRPPHPTRSSA